MNIGRGALIEHWNGSAWSIADSPNFSGSLNSTGLEDVVAISADDVWTVGNNHGGSTVTEHRDGSSWSVIPSPDPTNIQPSLASVAAVGANDVWAVGVLRETRRDHLVLDADGALGRPGVHDRAEPQPGLQQLPHGRGGGGPADDVWAVGVRQNIDGSVTGVLVETR